MLEPFKNRVVDRSLPVQIYRCLVRKGVVYSVRQGGQVVGHTSSFMLKSCKFVMNQAGRKRAVRLQERNVHAYVEGFLVPREEVLLKFSYKLTYNPFKNSKFEAGGREVDRGERVYTQEGKLYVQF